MLSLSLSLSPLSVSTTPPTPTPECSYNGQYRIQYQQPFPPINNLPYQGIGGYLQVCYSGTYYSICANDTFASIDDTIGQIVCTELGYRDRKCTLIIINDVSGVIYPTYMENWKSYNYYYICM